MADKLKIGVIGNGNISGVHLRGYSLNPNVEIYALCDINEKAMKRRAEEYGVTRLFTDVNEMVKLPELDAVSVCTWNAAHAECAIAALNAGTHVLCEKPMALNAEQAQRMQEAAERNGKLLMIGFVRRFGNDCAILKDFIDNGYFGDIYYAKATYLLSLIHIFYTVDGQTGVYVRNGDSYDFIAVTVNASDSEYSLIEPVNEGAVYSGMSVVIR